MALALMQIRRPDLERAAAAPSEGRIFPPSRACYYFSAKAFRIRPDIAKLLSVVGAFQLRPETSVKLISYQPIKG
jgi:hypothetical protein